MFYKEEEEEENLIRQSLTFILIRGQGVRAANGGRGGDEVALNTISLMEHQVVWILVLSFFFELGFALNQ